MYSKDFLIHGFLRWLEMMNYVASSQYYDPKRLAVFLDWLQGGEMVDINQITGKRVQQFFETLSQQKSKRTGAVLSIGTLRTYKTMLGRFARYLRQSGQGNIEVSVSFKGRSQKETVIFTKAEIEKLYRAAKDDLLGIRDQALLAVFYGCGLRRNEGANLELKDILPDKNLLYVRKGKGGKSRYVPMTGKAKENIMEYLQIIRPMLLNKEKHENFFVSITGKAIGASGLYESFRKLIKTAEIDKKAGLHSLRHSIATHLLLNGMKLSAIAKFLGHSSLESTQIYTHLKDEIQV